MANRLAAETSPYLRQHAGNPVDWYPWGEEAFERARREDKPVLLSVGYSACHWCHVMAHESFENPEIAALMNDLFVNIKVDREERPDVDTVYMQAVQAMSGRGGWPMTVFLTPEGDPFFGGTYYPPADRMGMRGFPAVLRAIAGAYRTQRAEVDGNVERLRSALQRAEVVAPDSSPPDASQVDAAALALVGQTDRRHGGFGPAPKFPHPMAVDLLLRRYAATGDRALWDAAEVTLERMARGGVRDQVGGGFHRYSVDATWSVPHFEKMLYDNAQLAPVYLHAFQLSGRPDLLDVVTSTLDYMSAEMRLNVGAFAASQDADSEGGEGSFFVWTPQQLDDVLGPDDGALAARFFGVAPGGNFEHGTTVLSVPYPLDQVAAALDARTDDLRQRVSGIRQLLSAARATRPKPARDDKVVTAWNALAIAAFAEAGAALQRDDYIATARTCAEFLLDALTVDGVLHRTWLDGQAKVPAFLEDTALLADALLTLYESSAEPRYFAAALRLARDVVERFREPDGRYYDTSRDAERLIVRPRTVDDNPVTAGQSAAAAAFVRIAAFTGDERWRDRAAEIVTPLAALLPRAPVAFAGLSRALELWVGPVKEIAIAGDVRGGDTRALAAAVTTRFDPLRVLAWGQPDGVPLLQDRPLVAGRAAAYVCERFVCAAPVSDADELAAALD